MKLRDRFALSIALLGLLSIVLPRTAQASSLTYTESATVSGSLDGTTFTNSLVTLSLTADTSGIFFNVASDIFVLNGTGTVSVSGGPSDTFSDVIGVYSGSGVAGFVDDLPSLGGAGAGIFGNNSSSAFVGYDLSTPIGPISSSSPIDFSLLSPFNTTGGTFEMTAISGPATFTATTPEPTSLLMLGTGLGLLGLLGRRRLARVSP